MAIASVELQKSVYTALSQGSYPVFEIVPPNTTMPYIVIGEEVLTYDNTKTSIRTVHNITIHTWHQGSSSATIKVMNDLVVQAILDGFAVSGFSMDRSTLEMQRTIKQSDVEDTMFHGVNQFEIILTQNGE